MSAMFPFVLMCISMTRPSFTRSCRYASRTAACFIRWVEWLLSLSRQAALLSQSRTMGKPCPFPIKERTGSMACRMAAPAVAPNHSVSHTLAECGRVYSGGAGGDKSSIVSDESALHGADPSTSIHECDWVTLMENVVSDIIDVFNYQSPDLRVAVSSVR